MTSRPAVTTSFVPKRRTRKLLAGAETMRTPATGITRTPASSGV